MPLVIPRSGHPGGERASQVLPSVNCSNCQTPVPFHELGDHVCSLALASPSGIKNPTVPNTTRRQPASKAESSLPRTNVPIQRPLLAASYSTSPVKSELVAAESPSRQSPYRPPQPQHPNQRQNQQQQLQQRQPQQQHQQQQQQQQRSIRSPAPPPLSFTPNQSDSPISNPSSLPSPTNSSWQCRPSLPSPSGGGESADEVMRRLGLRTTEVGGGAGRAGVGRRTFVVAQHQAAEEARRRAAGQPPSPTYPVPQPQTSPSPHHHPEQHLASSSPSVSSLSSASSSASSPWTSLCSTSSSSVRSDSDRHPVVPSSHQHVPSKSNHTHLPFQDKAHRPDHSASFSSASASSASSKPSFSLPRIEADVPFYGRDDDDDDDDDIDERDEDEYGSDEDSGSILPWARMSRSSSSASFRSGLLDAIQKDVNAASKTGSGQVKGSHKLRGPEVLGVSGLSSEVDSESGHGRESENDEESSLGGYDSAGTYEEGAEELYEEDDDEDKESAIAFDGGNSGLSRQKPSSSSISPSDQSSSSISPLHVQTDLSTPLRLSITFTPASTESSPLHPTPTADGGKQHRLSRPDLPKGKNAQTKRKACKNCGCAVGGDVKFVRMKEEGGVLCERDWKMMYLPKCRRCALPIESQAISSADGQLKGKYHRACFTCYGCDRPFDGQTFWVFDARPFCEWCYHRENGSLCALASCGKPIEGDCAVVEVKEGSSTSQVKLHPSCLRCDHPDGPPCMASMQEHYEIAHKRFCPTHMNAAWESKKEADRKSGLNVSGEGKPRKRLTMMVSLPTGNNRF
ncbi:Adaptor protein Enigma and related PDZ-LIM proteins [Phaffia rhodozyma]|uniref:Adaptor protein Enigma and related PDZ-LIM proteins n=1 Tax=Phaffia rhodozyma TaxID=264483 RepID=A0A0F7SM72_PHARH|nr:Adaptor protein Enigma and related PDZ-LIM proteins [Phaffia rhodozyma]